MDSAVLASSIVALLLLGLRPMSQSSEAVHRAVSVSVLHAIRTTWRKSHAVNGSHEGEILDQKDRARFMAGHEVQDVAERLCGRSNVMRQRHGGPDELGGIGTGRPGITAHAHSGRPTSSGSPVALSRCLLKL